MWALLLVIVALALYAPHSHCFFFLDALHAEGRRRSKRRPEEYLP